MMNNDMTANVIATRTALTPIVWGTTYAVTTTWLPAGTPSLPDCCEPYQLGLSYF